MTSLAAAAAKGSPCVLCSGMAGGVGDWGPQKASFQKKKRPVAQMSVSGTALPKRPRAVAWRSQRVGAEGDRGPETRMRARRPTKAAKGQIAARHGRNGRQAVSPPRFQTCGRERSSSAPRPLGPAMSNPTLCRRFPLGGEIARMAGLPKNMTNTRVRQPRDFGQFRRHQEGPARPAGRCSANELLVDVFGRGSRRTVPHSAVGLAPRKSGAPGIISAAEFAGGGQTTIFCRLPPG